jgi:hypothetical protein
MVAYFIFWFCVLGLGVAAGLLKAGNLWGLAVLAPYFLAWIWCEFRKKGRKTFVD